MIKTQIPFSVDETIGRIKSFLSTNNFEIFADIDHRSNAQAVDLDMPDSRVLIFGNPLAGTKLMQKDICMSLDLPLRLAVVEENGATFLLHPATADYSGQYEVTGHPVLEKIENMFAALISQLTEK